MNWEIESGSEKVDCFSLARELLPEHLRTGLENIKEAEELHLRCGRPLTVSCVGSEYSVDSPPVTAEDISRVLEKATGASVHSAISTMRYGFIPYRGLRIGICGRANTKDGQLVGFFHYRSIDIRIPGAFAGDLSGVAERICGKEFKNMLIVSPPGIGKTTALREIVRLVSDRGYTTAVADERDEIFPGEEYDAGAHTDVLTGIGKAEAVMMLLRTMGPRVIAFDEISRAEDIKAVKDVFGCGVGILATAHGKDREDMKKRAEYRELLETDVFRTVLEISADRKQRHYTLTEISP